MPESAAQLAASPDTLARAELSEEAHRVFRENSTAEQYVQHLSQAGLFPDAVKYCAHAMAEQPCVMWSLACIRKLESGITPPEDKAIQAAEKCLADPNDDNRRGAKLAAEHAELSTPAGCVALAAFFAGGSIAPPLQPEVLPPPHLAQKIAAGGIILAVVERPAEAGERYQFCLQLARDHLANAVSVEHKS